ncbi:MAG: IS5 family transposase [Pseudomonadales bacterium]|nr:IS5 family transposase [Pseudomonadales bacterium]
MSQLSFSDAEGQARRKKTRREIFLEEMDQFLPWEALEKPVRKHYSKSLRGRKPYPLSAMLRIHCMQLFYNLSDPGMEYSLYEVESMRRFSGISIDTIPDETTILNFRHLLEKHNLGEKLFHKINDYLSKKGLSFQEGTIVDASIISAPTSTKNKDGKRDPEMHQTKKGNEWHFGMKVHVGVDEVFGLIHSVSTSIANVHDIVSAKDLLHGKESRVWGDAGYRGIDKRDEHKDRSVTWFIAERPGVRKLLEEGSEDFIFEMTKAQMLAKVEHSFMYIKKMFGYSKRYRGLAKNENRLYLLAGFSNLIKTKKLLLA